MSETLHGLSSLGALIALVAVLILVGRLSVSSARIRAEIREATYWAGIARRDIEAAARFSEEAMAERRSGLGPWEALVAAIEAAPEGRLQIERSVFERAKSIPDSEVVNSYLWDRWPGLRVWREDEADYLGVIVSWADRP